MKVYALPTPALHDHAASQGPDAADRIPCHFILYIELCGVTCKPEGA